MTHKKFKHLLIIGMSASTMLFSGCASNQQNVGVTSSVSTMATLGYAYPRYFNEPYYYNQGRYYYGGYYSNGYYHYHGHRYRNGHYYHGGYRYHNGRRYRAKVGQYGHYNTSREYRRSTSSRSHVRRERQDRRTITNQQRTPRYATYNTHIKNKSHRVTKKKRALINTSRERRMRY